MAFWRSHPMQVQWNSRTASRDRLPVGVPGAGIMERRRPRARFGSANGGRRRPGCNNHPGTTRKLALRTVRLASAGSMRRRKRAAPNRARAKKEITRIRASISPARAMRAKAPGKNKAVRGTARITARETGTGAAAPAAGPGRSLPGLSRDSLVGQRIAISFDVQYHDGLMDGRVEALDVGEGLMREMMGFQIMPDNLDVV